MNVTCHTCKAKFNIPEHKIPQDKELTLKCPKCSVRIKIPSVNRQKTIEKKQQPSSALSFGNRQAALVLVDDDNLKKRVCSVIGQMGFNAEVATNIKAALTKMEYHIYPLVIVDDTFDLNKGIHGIMDRMNAMDMSMRRRICLIWISTRYNTHDNMASLHSSVNGIIHIDDAIHLEAVMSRIIKEHKNSYTVFNTALKQIGRV